MHHAFVYDGTEMIDLGTLGGLFSVAYGINNDGVVVGYAHDAMNVTQAVRWVPTPEPGTVCLVSLAMIVLLVRRGPRIDLF